MSISTPTTRRARVEREARKVAEHARRLRLAEGRLRQAVARLRGPDREAWERAYPSLITLLWAIYGGDQDGDVSGVWTKVDNGSEGP